MAGEDSVPACRAYHGGVTSAPPLVVLVRIAAPPPARLQRLLDAEESARAERFGRAEDRARFIVGRALLRLRLAAAAGVAPAAVRFAVGPHGKLAADVGPHFNLSHSGEYVAAALAEDAIGVDVQEHRATSDRARLAAEVFSEPEAVRAANAGFVDEVFFEIWAAKEAVVKADGRGIVAGLRTFATPPLSLAPRRITDLGAEPPHAPWSVARIEVAPGYSAATAFLRGDRTPRVERTTAEALGL
jgi:4'-phosphopantetheinyl transferase